MLVNALGVIIAYDKMVHLGDIEKPRSMAAVPFGGRYRIIDFMLSNMVNSNIRNIAVVTQSKYRSLMDHLGTGSSWDLDRKTQRLEILPPYVNSSYTGLTGQSELVNVLDYLMRGMDEYVIVTESKAIISTNFYDFMNQHIASGVDITVMYNQDGNKYGSPNLCLEMDKKLILKNILVDPVKNNNKKNSLGIIMLKRKLLIDIINEAISLGRVEMSVLDILKMSWKYKIKGYEYQGRSLRINSISSYFSANMQILKEDVQKDLFWTGLPVYTKVKDESPAIYNQGNIVKNSLVSDGCNISGEVINSVLFRNVIIANRARIKNCIIMQGVEINEGAELENVIVDKNAVIKQGVRLIGQENYPVVVEKGALV